MWKGVLLLSKKPYYRIQQTYWDYQKNFFLFSKASCNYIFASCKLFLKYIFSSLDLLIIAFLKPLVIYFEWFALYNFFINGACMFKTLKNVFSNSLHMFICVVDKIFSRSSLKDT